MADDVRVIHGDCLAVLPTLAGEPIAAVVTDPPYGTRVERDGYGRRQLYHGSNHIEGDEDLSAFAAMLKHVVPLLACDAWIGTFCSPKLRYDAETVCRESGLSVTGEVIWDKRTPGLGGGIRYQHETVLLCRKGKASGRSGLLSVISELVAKQKEGGHPHEKPLRLMAALVRYCSRPGDLILDPFAGSGTTGVAALKTGRRCILIEKDARYIPVIERRIAEARTPLFDAIEAGEGR